MNPKLLTIVIPTYNMEKYLGRCLDSLIVDGALMDVLQVLVVNDGSKDSSSQIAHEYAAKYPATFRVIDKENGNYGSCVNRGLKEAQGEYFKILDADDWFDTEGLSTLLREIKKLSAQDRSQPDIIFTKRDKYAEDGTLRDKMRLPLNAQELNTIIPAETLDFTTRRIPMLAMHCATVRTQLLRDNGYVQQEGISYTDVEFLYYALKWAKTYYFMDIVVYDYLVGRLGQTMNTDSLVRSLPSFYLVCKRLLQDYVSTTTPLDETILSNMLAAITAPTRYFYIIALLWKKHLTADEKARLNHIEAIGKPLRSNAFYQQRIGSFHKFPFVKFYRITHIRPHFIYYLLKK